MLAYGWPSQTSPQRCFRYFPQFRLVCRRCRYDLQMLRLRWTLQPVVMSNEYKAGHALYHMRLSVIVLCVHVNDNEARHRKRHGAQTAVLLRYCPESVRGLCPLASTRGQNDLCRVLRPSVFWKHLDLRRLTSASLRDLETKTLES